MRSLSCAASSAARARRPPERRESPVLELIAWVGACYAWQCCFLPPGYAMVLAHVAGQARLRPGGSIVVASPWPGDWTLPLAPLPIEIGSETLFARPPATAVAVASSRPSAIAFAEVVQIEAAGEWLRINDRPFARCASRTQAHSLAALVAELRTGAPAARLHIVRGYVERSLARHRLRAELPRLRAAARPLTGVCTLLVLCLFVALPLGAELGLSPVHWLAVGATLAALYLVGLILLVRAHRALPPGAPSRSALVLPVALFPPALLRAPDILLREGLADFHPLLVASEVLPPAEVALLLRRELARLAYPDWRGDSVDAGRREFQSMHREALLELARGLELPIADVLAPTAPNGPDAVSYCPACLGEFRPGFAHCGDCEVATVPFPRDSRGRR